MDRESNTVLMVRLVLTERAPVVTALIYSFSPEKEHSWSRPDDTLDLAGAADLLRSLVRDRAAFKVELRGPSGGPWPPKEAGEFAKLLVAKGVALESLDFGLEIAASAKGDTKSRP